MDQTGEARIEVDVNCDFNSSKACRHVKWNLNVSLFSNKLHKGLAIFENFLINLL